MKRLFILLASLAFLGTGMATTCLAQDAPSPGDMAAKATLTRQAVFKLLAFNFGPIYQMARGNQAFDHALAERNARRIASLAPMIPDLFATADTREFDVTTKALDPIWDDPEDFAVKAMDLVERANAFADVAAAGDQAATINAFRSLGAGCGNCHDVYKQDDD